MGRRPVLVERQRLGEGLGRLQLVVFFTEQLAPQGLDGRIVRRGERGVPDQAVRQPILTERPRRERGAIQVERLAGLLKPGDERIETRGRLVPPSEIVLQQRQLKPSGAEGVGRRDRLQARLGGRVVPTEHVQPGQQCGGRRVGGVARVCQLARVVVGAMRECPCCRAVKLLLLRPRVSVLGRQRDGPGEQGAQDGGQGAALGHNAPPPVCSHPCLIHTHPDFRPRG